MDGTVDVGTVVNGWQVLVVAIIIMGPGIAAWLTSLSAKRHAAATAHEMKNNSGSTLRDASDRQEAALERIEGKVDREAEIAARHREAQREVTTDLARRLSMQESRKD